MAKTLLLLIIAFVTLEFIVNSVLSWLNTKWMTHPVPPELEGLYDEEKYRKQQEYMKTNKRVSLVARCVSFGLTLVISGYSGGLTTNARRGPTYPCYSWCCSW